jgi:hypothetical protein
MQSWRRQTRSLLPCLLCGVVGTIATAWLVPLAPLLVGGSLASLGPTGPELRFVADPEHVQSSTDYSAWQAQVVVARGLLVDHCAAMRASKGSPLAFPPLEHLGGWPDAPLRPISSVSDIRSVPSGCVFAPDGAERQQYARIDTHLFGWPFRAFAGEAWFLASPRGWSDPTPEFRWYLRVGAVLGQPVLVAVRPLPLGFLADILVWAAIGWPFVTGLRVARRRLRERAGRCGGCGHARDPRGDPRAFCPECGLDKSTV